MEEYELVLEKISEIKDSGIPVKITKPTQKTDRVGDFLPFDKWIYVEFTVKNEIEKLIINEAIAYLSQAGIYFDVSAISGQREWQVDWSFGVNAHNEDWREAVEDLDCDFPTKEE